MSRTVALSLKEVRKVLNFVHKIKEGNKACIYISHDIQDVYEISDRFVIMDRGEIVASIAKKDITLKALDDFLLEYAHGMKDKESIMKRQNLTPCKPWKNRGSPHRLGAGRPVRALPCDGTPGLLRTDSDLHVFPADGAAGAHSRSGTDPGDYGRRDRFEFPCGGRVFRLRFRLGLQDL